MGHIDGLFSATLSLVRFWCAVLGREIADAFDPSIADVRLTLPRIPVEPRCDPRPAIRYS